jgi:hypothetical protein
MTMLTNLEQIRLPDVDIPNPCITTDTAETEKEWFIRGPIPGPWIGNAAKLGGNYTLHVALTIQYVRGFRPQSMTVILERFHFDRFGVEKDSARRALGRLQNAGLIKYTKAGHKYKVTVIPVETSSDEG